MVMDLGTITPGYGCRDMCYVIRLLLPACCRIKELIGPKPHNNLDAEVAGNMGAPDNGPKLRPHAAVPAPMAIS